MRHVYWWMALVPCLAACGGGSGQGGGGANLAPTLVSTLVPAFATIELGESIAFDVTGTDPDGDPVTLTLLNPPQDATFVRRTAAGQVTCQFRWLPTSAAQTRPRLFFRAEDDAGNVAVLTVQLRILALPTGGIDSVGSLCCDVTGDGVLDVIARAPRATTAASQAGALYVWAGGAAPSATPLATLTVPGAQPDDLLGIGNNSEAYLCCDVTGDGIDDIIVAAPFANAAPVDSGAVYVFRGGPTLAGAVAPHTTLRGDMLGDVFGLRILCCDVTGDSTPDLIAGSFGATVGGLTNVGVLRVWAGGPGLAGLPAPTASLKRPVAQAGDRLGLRDVLCRDVNGDGRSDLIVVSPAAGVAANDTGAIDIFAGGAAMVGTPAPLASLVVPNATVGDQLGRTTVRCCDVIGSSSLDIIASSDEVDVAGAVAAGAVYVFDGDTLSGIRAPTATLVRPAPIDNDRIGHFRCCDVTGDGRLDVITASGTADVNGQGEAGEVLVWAGGMAAGTPAPTATLRIPSPATFAMLGSDRRWVCCDVTGDTIADLVVAAPAFTDTASFQGALFVWAGGATLTGTPAPTARLLAANPSISDVVGLGGSRFDAPVCCDVTGDGVRDIVTTTCAFDGAQPDVGAVLVFAGGAALVGDRTPTALLLHPSPTTDDRLANGQPSVRCCDVTHDGVLDLVVAGALVDRGAATDAGAVYVWQGGATLTGTPAPTSTLLAPSPETDEAFGEVVQCCDVDADGGLDIVVTVRTEDLGPTPEAGAVYVFLGGALAAVPVPLVLTRAAPFDDERFGEQAPVCCDITGDGIVDLLVRTPGAHVGGVADVGMIAFWRGGAIPTPNPTLEFSVPGAVADDRLGE